MCSYNTIFSRPHFDAIPLVQATMEGTFLAYLDDNNKILEAHMFTSKGFVDWADRIAFIRRCGDAEHKYPEIHDIKKREL